MRDSEKSRGKSIEEAGRKRARKAKLVRLSSGGLERVTRSTTSQEKPQESLQIQKDFYQAVMENTHFGCTLIDCNYKILMVNSMISIYFHKPASELIGKKCFREFEQRNSICPHCPGRRAMATGQPADFETEGILDDGSRFSACIQAFPTLDSDGKITGFIEIVEDITERKKIEQQLKDAFNLNHIIIDTSPVGIWIFEESGQFVMFNPSGVALSGGIDEQLLKLNFRELESWKKSGLLQAAEEALLTGKLEKKEIHTVNTFNTEVWYEALLSAIQFKGKKHLLLMTYDIKDRKHSEEALRASRDYLVRLTNSMWDAVFSIKMPERVIEWANDSFRLIGYEPEECVGKTTEFLYPDKKEFLGFGKKLKNTIAAGNDILHAEQLLKRKNGEVFPADITITIYKEKDEVVRVTSIVRDITERKRAEQEIKNLAKFPSENPYPVLRIAKDGTVIYSNEAGLALLTSWRTEPGERLPDKWRKFIANVLKDGSSKDTEFEYDSRILSLTFAPVVDANYVNVYGLDITERKKAEQKLREDRQQLRSLASELTLAEERERSRIATELHDQTIQSVSISKMKLESLFKSVHDEAIEKKLEEICTSLGRTIKDMRSLIFKVSSPILEQFGFEEAVQDWLIEKIEKEHGIKTKFVNDQQDKPLGNDVSALLFRNVRELLINVVKHAGATKVKVSINKIGDKIKVIVEDNGSGFDPDKVMTKAVSEGGFGLFSIRQRLEYLGGKLEIKSEPNCGCTIIMTAPLKQDVVVQGKGDKKD